MSLVAGIFFADDNIIFGGGDVITTDRYPGYTFRNIFIARIPAGNTKDSPQVEVGKAMYGIQKYFQNNGKKLADAKSIATASLGPQFGKIVGDQNHGRHMSGLRLEKWDGFDIVASVRSWREGLVTIPNKDLQDSNFLVRSYLDVEAMVMGEYHIMLNTGEIELVPNQIPQDTLAVLLADEGVNGAVKKRGSIIRGEMHAELGHMRVNLHKDDKFRCDGRPINDDDKIGRRLSYLASLSAMERRWGLTGKEYERNKLHDGTVLNPKFIDYLGYYYGQAVANLAMFYSPTKVKLVGRVFDHPDLMLRIKFHYEDFAKWRGHERLYPGYPAQQNTNDFINVQTNKDIGILGCLCGAAEAAIGRVF